MELLSITVFFSRPDHLLSTWDECDDNNVKVEGISCLLMQDWNLRISPHKPEKNI